MVMYQVLSDRFEITYTIKCCGLDLSNVGAKGNGSSAEHLIGPLLTFLLLSLCALSHTFYSWRNDMNVMCWIYHIYSVMCWIYHTYFVDSPSILASSHEVS